MQPLQLWARMFVRGEPIARKGAPKRRERRTIAPPEIDDFVFAIFTMHRNDRIRGTQEANTLRLVEIRAGDMQIAIALGFGAFEDVVRKIIRGYGPRNFGGAKLDFSTVRGRDGDGSPRIPYRDGIGPLALPGGERCEIPVLVKHTTVCALARFRRGAVIPAAKNTSSSDSWLCEMLDHRAFGT